MKPLDSNPVEQLSSLRLAIRANPLKVVAGVNSGGDGSGRSGSGGDGAGETVARAGRRVFSGVAAGSRGVGRDGVGGDGGGAVLEATLAGTAAVIDSGGNSSTFDVRPLTSRPLLCRSGTYTASGVTVVMRKLWQSAERTLAGVRPGRVPVMARLQLFPAQARFSTATLARATDTRDRTTANFILTDWEVAD